ncbi:lactosylceramide 4-alpha-galactosyltransferase-like [Chironomus tepperi]|uniref:lactosylceramide 4-alpha-galactosyltransferase-like n=1 Tax=Chironomus tepperi TaxID=113505 RepID=UPI00391F24EB
MKYTELKIRALKKYLRYRTSNSSSDSILAGVHVVGLLLIILLFVLSIFLLNVSDESVPNCYLDNKYWRDGKTLKEISDNLVLRNSSQSKNVFFHETSCKTNGILELNARQACAIESTALMNPDHNIFVMFTSQVGLRNTSRLPIIDALLSYPNVHMNYLNITKYAENTPLEDWIMTNTLFNSQYLISHTSDVLRFLSLYKYGGTYLDLDIVMLKSLNSQKSHNYAGAESYFAVAVGIIHMEGKTGHEIARMCLNDLKRNFNGKKWANNGPFVLTRVLYEICKSKDIQRMIYENICPNFKVLPVEDCYDIGWQELRKFFEPAYLNETLGRISDALITHVWNKDSARIPLTKDTDAAYIHLARKYCPKTLEACDSF